MVPNGIAPSNVGSFKTIDEVSEGSLPEESLYNILIVSIYHSMHRNMTGLAVEEHT